MWPFKKKITGCLRCGAPMERVGDKGETCCYKYFVRICLPGIDILYFDLYCCTECSYAETRKR